MRIGVDAGGTFTDFAVLHDDGRLETFKLRSNPQAPAAVILAGLERAAAPRAADVIHGSTVATNALLERKGARTAFVTTAGFEDLLHIGRQNRDRLYVLNPPPKRFLTPRELCFGAAERTLYDGSILLRPSRPALARLRSGLRRAGVDAIAVSLLNAYQNQENEKAVAAALDGLGYVCASHEVCPEFREYERSSTTALNAYVGPIMDAYLGELERQKRHSIAILQSNGGFMTAAEARRHAVRTVLSGPAGGVIGCCEAARASGFRRVIGFDMGGTSTDVSLSDGAPRESVESTVDGIPIRVPMLDIHTVGAGGGSIARVDEGGLLRVGPESAGADPGPACYGVGDLPTVTDAHVVLGRIAAGQLAGGEMRLDPGRAAAAIGRLARELRLDPPRAAEGVLRVADANMLRAIRVVSIERGFDPRDFALLAFGGCGGLHACAIARELGIRTVLAPENAGALSAIGMLMAARVRDYAAGVRNRAGCEERFVELEGRARQELPETAELTRLADLRYAGQSYELTVPWHPTRAEAAFHRAHRKIYGYADAGRPVEVVTVRLRARVPVARPRLRATAASRSGEAPTVRRVWVDGGWRDVPALLRHAVSARPVSGPALIADYGSTTLISAGWTFRRDRRGMIVASWE